MCTDRFGFLVSVVAVLFSCVCVSNAGIVPLVVVDDLTDLLGPNPVALGSLDTIMENEGLAADVLSQAFSNEAGDSYAYLYQVDNSKETSVHFIEVFTLCPFAGANENTQMGWLAGDIPAGFDTGGQDPWDQGNVSSVGPTVTFYYLDAFDKAMFKGEHSVVMYVLSDLPPDVIVGNIINGSVADGPVVGPLPEPATIAMLGLGALALLRKRRN